MSEVDTNFDGVMTSFATMKSKIKRKNKTLTAMEILISAMFW